MLIEAARQAKAAAKQMLALVTEGSVSCGEILDALAVSKAIAGVNSAFQVAGAAAVAGRERHGDGGAEVLAAAAGLSRREAHSQVKTAEALRDVPEVLDAVANGRVSMPNARRLAEAVDKTGADTVSTDSELLAKAESMRPEQFAKEARRWVIDREGDDGEGEYRRQQARRCVRVWDGDDGMVHLRGEFDTVTGRRIGNRLRAEAGRLHDADKQHAADARCGERRTFQQCMADALDNLTSNTGATSSSGKPFADICVVAHVDDSTGELIAELPDGVRLPQSVLQQFACNAKFTGVVYDREGRPIWRAHSVRCATEAQRQILIARYGGCFACAAHPALCQIHHIKPVSQGGSTKLENMVPVCWDCHNKIHIHGWQIRTIDGEHTLHPPQRIHHGPAHAPEQPPQFKTGPETAPKLSSKAAQPQTPTHRDRSDTIGPPMRAGPATAWAALYARAPTTTSLAVP